MFSDMKLRIRITVEDGLVNNNASGVLQDSKGFIWAGTTSGGLSKYDGVEFTNHVNAQNDQHSLPNNCAWRLYQDKKGNMWIVTWGAVCHALIRSEMCLSHIAMMRTCKQPVEQFSQERSS